MGSRVAGLAVLLALQACHAVSPSAPDAAPPSQKGEVSYTLVPAAGASQYKLKRSEHAFGAQVVANDPPAYPAALVASRLPPVTVRVKAIIDGAGTVTEVRDLDNTGSPNHALFLAACRDAVMHWRYTPMTVVEEFDDGKGNITQERKTAPFSLDYAFQFELVDGRPSVTATR